ncbi:Anoctamin-like protein [Vitis vinifera]|uniref:Anoctamin-like protein n=1 Tax=Vitis vinifera TaxID=29760 RepID=A0A438EWA4_VITVI|nr:Anoctamin-like protein [Vitis vinifera]
MNGQGEERTAFEIGVVVPKRAVKERDESFDCVEVLVEEFKQAGLIVEKVIGIADEFIKVACLKPTGGKRIVEGGWPPKKSNNSYSLSLSGMDLQFEWDEVEAFVRQPDGSLFSWWERFRCFNHLIYGIVSHSLCTPLFLNFEAVELRSYCAV